MTPCWRKLKKTTLTILEISIPALTGAQFLQGLQGGREVWVNGARVANIVEHPSLTGAAHALAEVFDIQHQHPESCLMPDPDTGELINASHMIPRSTEDLRQRCMTA